MHVYWLEQTEANVPEDNTWLSPREVAFVDRLRFAKRRADWRLGRWTAKRAGAACLDLPATHDGLARLEIRPSPSGAPELFVDYNPTPVAISLSHSGGRAACALASHAANLGCDLELIEPRTDAFISDYFTEEEQALVSQAAPADRDSLATLIWSAKESALKALRMGLRLDTRRITIMPGGRCGQTAWTPLRALCVDGQIFPGWWRSGEGNIRTMVADPIPEMPIGLEISMPSSNRSLHCA